MSKRFDIVSSVSDSFVPSTCGGSVKKSSRSSKQGQFNSQMPPQLQINNNNTRSCDDISNLSNNLSNGFNGYSVWNNNQSYGLDSITNKLNNIGLDDADSVDDIDKPSCQISSNTTRGSAAAGYNTRMRHINSMDNMNNIPAYPQESVMQSSSSNSSYCSYDSIGDCIDAPATAQHGSFNKSSSFNRFSQFTSFVEEIEQPKPQQSLPTPSAFGLKDFVNTNNFFGDYKFVPIPKESNKSHAPQEVQFENVKNVNEQVNNNFGQVNNNNNNNDEDDIIMFEEIYVPSKLEGCRSQSIYQPRIIQDDGAMVKPEFYNEDTSCVIKDSPLNILQTIILLLGDIYSSYTSDEKIEGDDNNNNHINNNTNKCDRNAREVDVCEINRQDFTITGITFIKHKSTKFIISIWHETEYSGINGNDYLSRVEVLKRNGDTLVFHQFWSELLELMYKNFNGNISGAIRCPDFESYFIPKFDLPAMDLDCSSDESDDSDGDVESDYDVEYSNNVCNGVYRWKKEDIDELAMDLKQDYNQDGLDVLVTVCDTINKDDLFTQHLIKHDEMIKLLIKTLKHIDICHVRGALCALDQIMDKMSNENDDKNKNKDNQERIECLVSNSSILGNLSKLVTHTSRVIKRRAELLMVKLADITKLQWNVEDKVRKQIDAWVIQFADNDNYSVNNNGYDGNYYNDYNGVDIYKLLGNVRRKLC